MKSSVADLQVEANAMYSEKNIYVSKVQNLQEQINTITSQLNSTSIKKEKSGE